jgi:hypothetical protein
VPDGGCDGHEVGANVAMPGQLRVASDWSGDSLQGRRPINPPPGSRPISKLPPGFASKSVQGYFDAGAGKRARNAISEPHVGAKPRRLRSLRGGCSVVVLRRAPWILRNDGLEVRSLLYAPLRLRWMLDDGYPSARAMRSRISVSLTRTVARPVCTAPASLRSLSARLTATRPAPIIVPSSSWV